MPMETVLETIDLDLDESSHELQFKVNVEGATAPVKVRLVCESTGVSYVFAGHPMGKDGMVKFILPRLKDVVEGTYESTVEVLMENRYFAPVKFGICFKRAVKVFAESIVAAPKRLDEPKISVIAVRAMPKPPTRPAVIEAPEKRSGTSLKERYQRRSKS
jgi:hypothetical protein